MNIQLRETDGIPAISLLGDVNAEDAEPLEEMVDSLVDGGHNRIIFDLSHAKFIASNIYGVLLGTASRLNQKGGRVALAAASSRVKEVLHLLSMEQFFHLYESEAEALGALKKV